MSVSTLRAVEPEIITNDMMALDGPKCFRLSIAKPNKNNKNLLDAPASKGLSTYVSYHDKNGRHVEIQYVERYDLQQINGQTVRAPFPSRSIGVNFRAGNLVVPKNKPGLYSFLQRHPGNRDNPDRPIDYPVEFFLLDPARDKRIAVNVYLENEKAKQWMSDKIQVAGENLTPLAKKFGVDDKQAPAMIQYELLQYAEKNATAILNQESGKVKVNRVDEAETDAFSLVEKALELKVITYHPASGTYFWSKEYGETSSERKIYDASEYAKESRKTILKEYFEDRQDSPLYQTLALRVADSEAIS